MDFPVIGPKTLESGGSAFAFWMKMNALPVWNTLGRGDFGLVAEAISLEGIPVDRPVRARTQTRQIYVNCRAGALGWRGPWKASAKVSLDAFCTFNGRTDGFFRTLVSQAGAPLDDTVSMYDQAFALFALSSAKAVGLDGEWTQRAEALREALLEVWPAGGGLTEASDQPFQSNPHMHMLEACLAWEEISDDPVWAACVDRLVHLTLTKFISPTSGMLREFFDENWQAAPGVDGRLIEPGHQFEWCWLLTRYARRRDDLAVAVTAQKLYAAGKLGIDPARGIALDSMNEDGGGQSERGRLWPQTEWLKAALILAETSEGDVRATYVSDAEAALNALSKYLEPSGLWRDKMAANGFVDEPAPATSLYHIMAAFEQLHATSKALNLATINLV